MDAAIFAKTFVRPELESCLDAVIAHGLRAIQFNFACAGLPTLPDHLDDDRLDSIRRALNERNVSVPAVSGTFNLIDPDIRRRKEGLGRLDLLARASAAIGAPLITLCTGTRHQSDMWKFHPENSSPEAWRDLLKSMQEAIGIAERYRINLGIEPETSNVIASPRLARRLLDELKVSSVKIVIDPANLFLAGDLIRQREILQEAFDLLGNDIILAHAKDVQDNGSIVHVAAGKGELDYDLYIRLLHQIDFDGAIVLHGLTEQEAGNSIAFLRAKLQCPVSCRRI